LRSRLSGRAISWSRLRAEFIIDYVSYYRFVKYWNYSVRLFRYIPKWVAGNRMNHFEMLRKTQETEFESAEVYAGGETHKSRMTYCLLSILYLDAAISISYECIIIAVSRRGICLAEEGRHCQGDVYICYSRISWRTPKIASLCSRYGE